MELYQLRTFAAVAQAGHLTRAAEKLFISQPAVSAHIKALEEELGVALFTRSARGMQLTREGQALLGQAERMLALAAEMQDSARNLRRELSGELRLALHTDAEFLRGLALLDVLRARHPKLQVHLRQSMSGDIIEDVREGRLDCGFAYGNAPPEGELSAFRVCRTELCVVGPPDWEDRLAGADWPQLVDEPWIWFTESCPYRPLLSRCLGGAPTRVVAVTDYEGTLKSLVASGAGLSLMRRDEAERHAACGEVCLRAGSGEAIDVYFIYRRNREADPAILAVLSALRSVWELDGISETEG
ncbi:MAG TPA: LysR family transcriptional regulator [Humidesulfovibrio sp.]|uniref:LysR family transcriptional regulator n=1 Tax=Humidesulfovibrio sp. TaxID=2910988 RepID=UPI002C2469BC|nr:LysR family transcriptional regulator [Humidesulfovibrio sp.]HWR04703.1 LysR family transcriptional regulator [Humidesulfovibrio sp.]